MSVVHRDIRTAPVLYIVWNEAEEIGIVTKDYQMTYELRKNASNSLGIIDPAFQEAWGDAYGEGNNTVQVLAKEEHFGEECFVDAGDFHKLPENLKIICGNI